MEPRNASVVVGGKKSSKFVLKDMVFQGTVLGAPLWALFFADVDDAVDRASHEAAIYADLFGGARRKLCTILM